jgi:hypothetical protein
MAAMHKEPSNKDEIPELCKQTFVSTKAGLTIIWVLAGVMLSCAGTAIGWAMTTNTAITEIKGTQSVLQTEINSKLDFLIKQKEK